MEPVAIDRFEFSPTGGAGKTRLALGDFESSFQGLERVTFVQSPAETQFFVDNIVGSFAS